MIMVDMRVLIDLVYPVVLFEAQKVGGSGMVDTIRVLNDMVENKIIGKYAIAGAVAAYNYIEPTVTDDLDVLVSFETASKSGLVSLQPIVAYLGKLGYTEWRHEGIVVGAWTVQFLPVSGALDAEALDSATTVDAGNGGLNLPCPVIRPEYIIASALIVGRPKDYVRIGQFIEDRAFDRDALNKVLLKHDLMAKWNIACNRLGLDDPFNGDDGG